MTDAIASEVVGLTQRIAEFAATFRLPSAPPRAVQNAKSAILDCLGVSVLATSQEIGTTVLRFAREDAAPGSCTIWGADVTANARDAALINGTLAHGLDFDDRAHSTTYTLAAPMGPAEQRDASGAALLEAFIVGREVRNCLDPLFSHRDSGIGPGAKGWHSNGVLGAIASTCAAGKILGLDGRTMLAAIGLAAGSCGALTRDGGTMAKPYRCGHAASTGLTAALLAKSGMSSDDTVIEGRYGLLDALGPIPDSVMDALAHDLGVKYHLEADIRGKTYASCTASQGGLEAMLRLSARHKIDPESVAAIECDCKPYPLVRERPRRGYEGRFSMPYCLTMALLHQRLDPSDFNDAMLNTPAVQRLMACTTHTAGSPVLVVILKDGTRLTESVERPVSITEWPQFAAKFRACVRGTLDDSQADEIVTMVSTLEQVPSIRQLTLALKPEKQLACISLSGT